MKSDPPLHAIDDNQVVNEETPVAASGGFGAEGRPSKQQLVSSGILKAPSMRAEMGFTTLGTEMGAMARPAAT